jgi:peptidyl-prolyl isomerase D
MSTSNGIERPYFDVTIDGQPSGRIIFEVAKETPKTGQNFIALCKGDQTNADGLKLSYEGSTFHR